VNTDKYKNNKPYPAKADFTTTWWYRAGKAVAKRNPGMETEILDPRVGIDIELGACANEKSIDQVAYKAALRAYDHETARLVAQFKHDMFVELGIVDNPKADKLYSIAWEQGHSSGYSEVLSYAWNIVDLIKD
jgi:TPR repeat protein